MIARLLAAALIFASSALSAQTLTLITTSGPGSLSDTAARFTAMLLERELGRPVIVDNRPGGMGVIGLRHFNGLPADGHSILIAGTQLAFVSKAMPQPDFDPMTAFVPLSGLVYTPQQIMVPAASPVRSPADLLALQRSKGKLDGGSSHPSTQTSMGLLDGVLGTRTTIVGYKQGSQLATELAGGFIDYTIGGKGNGATAGFIDSGQIRVVGFLKDLGVEEFSWVGVFVQKGVPEDVKAQLQAAMTRVLKSEAWQNYTQQERWAATPQQVLETMRREYELIPSP